MCTRNKIALATIAVFASLIYFAIVYLFFMDCFLVQYTVPHNTESLKFSMQITQQWNHARFNFKYMIITKSSTRMYDADNTTSVTMQLDFGSIIRDAHIMWQPLEDLESSNDQFFKFACLEPAVCDLFFSPTLVGICNVEIIKYEGLLGMHYQFKLVPAARHAIPEDSVFKAISFFVPTTIQVISHKYSAIFMNAILFGLFVANLVVVGLFMSGNIQAMPNEIKQ